MNDWYTKWFNNLYLELYSHRSPAEAATHIDFLLEKISPKLALDVACGSGRHVEALRNAGVAAWGLDRSIDLLNHSNLNSKLVCADMRFVPYKEKTFDLLTSFFTSFGYFQTDEEHQQLLIDWSKLLIKDGYIFIDYLNHLHVKNTLVPESVKEINNFTVIERRRFSDDGLRVIKDISVKDRDSQDTHEFKESVRMYSFVEMQSLLAGANFKLISSFGDFTGTKYDKNSTRMLLIAQKQA